MQIQINSDSPRQGSPDFRGLHTQPKKITSHKWLKDVCKEPNHAEL